MRTALNILAIALVFTIRVKAADRFPLFSESKLNITLLTGMRGYQSIPSDQPTPQYNIITNTVGTNDIITTNVIFKLIGQIFTNASEGWIQLTSEGFSGKTDKSTPWKTLTELLAAYQQGSDEKMIRSLYNVQSQAFLDKIYGTSEMTAKMKAHGLSIARMQIELGFEFNEGFVAFVNIIKQSGTSYVNPFYLIKTNGVFLLSTFRDKSKMIQNIGVHFNTHSVKDMVK